MSRITAATEYAIIRHHPEPLDFRGKPLESKKCFLVRLNLDMNQFHAMFTGGSLCFFHQISEIFARNNANCV